MQKTADWITLHSEDSTSDQTIYTVRKATPTESKGYYIAKRAFDLVVSFFGLLILSPLILILMLLVCLDSKGPAFYLQERLGKNGKPFRICKFRSMAVDAERDGPRWADKDDDRCTRMGRFLRKCRLDELPQLWNIFLGQMSFVGPRPERACFYEEFEEYIHGFSYRMQVKPGLTGLAQVEGGYDFKPEEKIVYDMEYIAHASFVFDMKLVFRTFRLIFTHEGAR